MLTLIGLLRELRECIKYGRVSKLPNLLRLLLPQFTGTSASKYLRELVAMLLLEKACTKATFETMIDSLLIRAKGEWFVAVDTTCKQLVRVIKEIFVEKGGSFGVSNLVKYTAQIAPILYGIKIAVVNSSLYKDQIKSRRKHYNPAIDEDIFSVAELIVFDRVLHHHQNP